MVYVGSADKNLYAINAKTGVEVWKYTAAGTVGSPAVFNDTVYVGSADGSYNWIGAYTGALITNESSSAAVVINAPAVANGVVYYGNANGTVFGFYLIVTAVEGWRAVTGGAVTGALTVANGQVSVGSGDDSLYAYDLSGGGQTKISPPERPDPKSLQPNLERTPTVSQQRQIGFAPLGRP